MIRSVLRPIVGESEDFRTSDLHHTPRPHVVGGLDHEGVSELFDRVEHVVVGPAGVVLRLRYSGLMQAPAHLDLVGGRLRHVDAVPGKVQRVLHCSDGQGSVGAHRDDAVDLTVLRSKLLRHADRAVHIPGAHDDREIGELHAVCIRVEIGHHREQAHFAGDAHGRRLEDSSADYENRLLHRCNLSATAPEPRGVKTCSNQNIDATDRGP
jgi:hypothetical protein